MTKRSASLLAWGLCAIAVAATTVFLVLLFVTPESPENLPREIDAAIGLAVLSFPAVGAVIASRRSENPIGWLLCGAGVISALQAATGKYAIYALQTNPGSLPAGELAGWAFTWLTVGTLVPGLFVLLLFPDGSPSSARWRVFGWCVGCFATFQLLLAAFSPGPLLALPQVRNPVGIQPAGFLNTLLKIPIWAFMWVVAWLGSAVSLVMRYRKAGWEQRQQIKWLASAGLVLAVGMGLLIITFDPNTGGYRGSLLRDTGAVLAIVGIVGLAVAIGMAILKRRLLDIDIIVRKSLVYATLTALIVAAYLGIAATLGFAGGGRLPVAVAVLVTAVATFSLQPVRRFLERLLEGRLFGRRFTDEELLRRFGTSLQETTDPQELLDRLATTARRGLDFSWARVSLHGGRTTTEGRPKGPPALVVPIAYGGEKLGEIECGPKTSGVISDKDAELLATLAAQSALAVHNARLAARIVQAQDAERRRIERNIHDGAQQQLAALVANLGQAKEKLRREGNLSQEFLAELQNAALAILGELQELARGIYPSVLTDGGLLAAIWDRCAGLPIPVRIESDPLFRSQRFPPDIEGAAYFVAMEALANTLKHAKADSAVVSIRWERGRIVLEVSDDGVGFDPSATSPGGLTHLADRVAAVGGSLQVKSVPSQGTRVTAELPVHRREHIDG